MKRWIPLVASAAAALIIPATVTAASQKGGCQILTRTDYVRVFGPRVTVSAKGIYGCTIQTASYGHFTAYLNPTAPSYLPRFFKGATAANGFSRIPGLGTYGWYQDCSCIDPNRHSEAAYFARHGFVFAMQSNTQIGAPRPTKAQFLKLTRLAYGRV